MLAEEDKGIDQRIEEHPEGDYSQEVVYLSLSAGDEAFDDHDKSTDHEEQSAQSVCLLPAIITGKCPWRFDAYEEVLWDLGQNIPQHDEESSDHHKDDPESGCLDPCPGKIEAIDVQQGEEQHQNEGQSR